MATINFDETNFQSETSSWLTLVDFWAEWCGPCQAMNPILQDFAWEVEGKMKVGKVNVDENPGLAQQFRIMSIPTLVVMKDGKPVDMVVGLQQKENLQQLLEKHS